MGAWLRIVIWLVVAACSTRATTGPSSTPLVDLDARRPGDVREQRAVTLDNGLRVLLVSDAKLQTSSAALAVEVGSLEDPDERLGMAHFLEHVLFLGTEKYPSEGEYGQYVRSNGGYSNAYTASDHTNYLFEVNHDAYEGALDRFAQFFVAPLFTAEFVDREMNAVNSEHAKNLQNDYWRTRMVTRLLHRDGHPRQKFSTGNVDTLGGTTRDELIAFYERHYSANRMTLAMLGTASLDRLEALAREKFSPIENRNVEAPTYPSDIFPDGLPQLIDVVPVGDERTLRLEWSMPPTTEHWASKPGQLLGSIMGHEGEGSLLSALKREGLATSLAAGINNESYRAIFSLDMDLTETGMADIDRVIEVIYGFVALLRDQGLSERYYREQQVVGDLDYYFREHVTGGRGAAFFTDEMRHHPATEVERRLYTYSAYDPELFAEYVALLRPNNMRVVRVSKGLETDRVETYYGTNYAVGGFPEATVAAWTSAEPTEGMALPPVNPYLPSDISLLANDPAQAPYRVVDDERGVLWFQQDRRFELPRAHVSLLLLTPEVNRDPRSRLLAELYVRAIREGLNEWAYLVLEAGLATRLSSERRGLRIYVDGYAQRIPTLMTDVADRLDDIVIDETTFAAIKDELAREYANSDLDLAVRQGFYELSLLLDPHGIHREKYEDLVSEITLDEVKAFADVVFDRVAIEGAAYGNLEGEVLADSVGQLFEALGAAPLPESDRPPERQRIQLPVGRSSLVYENGTDNHAWVRYAEFGPRDPRTEAILRLGSTHLGAPFFAELRTRQQLGYIVGSSASTRQDGLGMQYYLQSGEYDATTLGQRAEAYLAEAVPTLRELDDETFAALQQSVVDTLSQETESMGDELDDLEHEAFTLDGDFAWDDKVIAEVGKVTRADLADAFAKALDPVEGRSLVIHVDAKGEAPSTPPNPIADKDAFREGRPTF